MTADDARRLALALPEAVDLPRAPKREPLTDAWERKAGRPAV